MDIIERNKIYNAGIEEGKKHRSPSSDTLKIIKNMEDKFDNLKDRVSDFEKNIIEEIGSIKLQVQTTIKEEFDKCDERYAPIWAAQVLKLVMGATALAMVGSVLALILK